LRYPAIPATITIDIDPVIVRLGDLAIGWYGLAVFSAIGAALLIAQHEVRRRDLPLDVFWSIGPWAILGGLVGARALYVIDHWSMYTSEPLRFFAFHEGGLAIGGAVLGGIVATLAVARRQRAPLLSLADAAAPGIILGQAIGRLGCLVTGDALGTETGLPWGIRYLNPGSMAPDRALSYQPVFAYEALWDLAVFGVLWMLRKRINRPGSLFATYLALYAAGKFAITFLREERRWLWSLQEAHFVALSLVIVSAGLWMWV
jgi:phosphatidylglycerol:prolipoprotein diacylglycerol transferase